MKQTQMLMCAALAALWADIARAASASPEAKPGPAQTLAKVPDTDPKDVIDRLEQIQQKIYVSQQKDVMLQFLLQEQGKVLLDFVYYPTVARLGLK